MNFKKIFFLSLLAFNVGGSLIAEKVSILVNWHDEEAGTYGNEYIEINKEELTRKGKFFTINSFIRVFQAALDKQLPGYVVEVLSYPYAAPDYSPRRGVSLKSVVSLKDIQSMSIKLIAKEKTMGCSLKEIQEMRWEEFSQLPNAINFDLAHPRDDCFRYDADLSDYAGWRQEYKCLDWKNKHKIKTFINFCIAYKNNMLDACCKVLNSEEAGIFMSSAHKQKSILPYFDDEEGDEEEDEKMAMSLSQMSLTSRAVFSYAHVVFRKLECWTQKIAPALLTLPFSQNMLANYEEKVDEMPTLGKSWSKGGIRTFPRDEVKMGSAFVKMPLTCQNICAEALREVAQSPTLQNQLKEINLSLNTLENFKNITLAHRDFFVQVLQELLALG